MDDVLSLALRYGWLAALLLWTVGYVAWHFVGHRWIDPQPDCRCFQSTRYGYYWRRADVRRARRRAAATRRKAHP